MTDVFSLEGYTLLKKKKIGYDEFNFKKKIKKERMFKRVANLGFSGETIIAPKSILISSLIKNIILTHKNLLYHFSTPFYNITFIRYSILQFYTLK